MRDKHKLRFSKLVNCASLQVNSNQSAVTKLSYQRFFILQTKSGALLGGNHECR